MKRQHRNAVDSGASESCAFPQSRRLTHYPQRAWIDSLFEHLERSPRTALYSLAFSICAVPTHGVTTVSRYAKNDDKYHEANDSNDDDDPQRRSRSALLAAREMFDLIDDLLHDEPDVPRRHRARLYQPDDFARSCDLYHDVHRERIWPIYERYRDLLSPPQPFARRSTIVDENDDASMERETTSRFVAAIVDRARKRENRNDGDEYESIETLGRRFLRDIDEMIMTLSTVNDASSKNGIRVPMNVNCSRSCTAIDVSSLIATRDRLVAATTSNAGMSNVDEFATTNGGLSDENVSAISDMSRIMADVLTSAISGAGDNESDDNETARADAHRAKTATSRPRVYTHIEAYLSYAPTTHRYRSLYEIMRQRNAVTKNEHSRWRRPPSANLYFVNDRDDPVAIVDGEILPIPLPARSVWQSGTSQILWIVLHSIAALVVQKRNLYIRRLIVLLENLSFFVWCADCSAHWAENRGDEYFRHIANLPVKILNRTPVDMILLRCHDRIRNNSHRGRVAPYSSWTLANVCLDYRDFANRYLLDRADREKAIEFRSFEIEPLRRTISFVFDDDEDDDDDDDIADKDGTIITADNSRRRTLDTLLRPVNLVGRWKTLLSTSLDTATESYGGEAFERDDDRVGAVAFDRGGEREATRDTSAPPRSKATVATTTTNGGVTLARAAIERQKRRVIVRQAITEYYGTLLWQKLWNDIDASGDVPIAFM